MSDKDRVQVRSVPANNNVAKSISGLTDWLVHKGSNASSCYVASKARFAINNTADYLDNSNVGIMLAAKFARDLKYRSGIALRRQVSMSNISWKTWEYAFAMLVGTPKKNLKTNFLAIRSTMTEQNQTIV